MKFKLGSGGRIRNYKHAHHEVFFDPKKGNSAVGGFLSLPKIPAEARAREYDPARRLKNARANRRVPSEHRR
jgi:hypothetical protein